MSHCSPLDGRNRANILGRSEGGAEHQTTFQGGSTGKKDRTPCKTMTNLQRKHTKKPNKHAKGTVKFSNNLRGRSNNNDNSYIALIDYQIVVPVVIFVLVDVLVVAAMRAKILEDHRNFGAQPEPLDTPTSRPGRFRNL